MGKLISLNKLIDFCNKFSNRKKVVLATGVFDILHTEHIHFLKNSKKAGDILIVGIESDRRVCQLKGKGRPINLQKKRAETIAALKTVDYSFILPKNLGTRKGREDLIKKLKPQIYAVSAHSPFLKEKQRIMKKFKGKLKIVLPHNSNISTTKIINSF